jgi:hypothetical protein
VRPPSARGRPHSGPLGGRRRVSRPAPPSTLAAGPVIRVRRPGYHGRRAKRCASIPPRGPPRVKDKRRGWARPRTTAEASRYPFTAEGGKCAERPRPRRWLSLACPVERQGAGRAGTEPEGGCPVLGGAISCTDCPSRRRQDSVGSTRGCRERRRVAWATNDPEVVALFSRKRPIPAVTLLPEVGAGGAAGPG